MPDLGFNDRTPRQSADPCRTVVTRHTKQIGIHRIIAFDRRDFQANPYCFHRSIALYSVWTLTIVFCANISYASAVMSRFPEVLLVMCLILIGSSALSQQPEEIRVSTRRLPDSLSEQIYSTTTFDRSVFNGPSFGLDDTLRRLPGFGLFRRQAARAAHPTTQGVSLRGLGPNGAGRTLVLLDGIPQNDPFGGWVEWVHLPPVSIGQATIVRGGGAGPWGNAALAGVVRLDSTALTGELIDADLRYGSKDSLSASAVFEVGTDGGTMFGTAHASDSNGYFLMGSNQRGAADRPAARHSEGVRLGWRTRTENGTSWSLVGSIASDSLVNGSDVAGAETDTYSMSVSAVHDAPTSGPAWQSNLYVRHKDFASVFGAFDDSRDSVRPVLDQFDVPAIAVGGNVVLRWQDAGPWTIESGADIRFSDGETNEQFRNLGAGFTRERTAGGEQWLAGAFAEGHWQGSDRLLVTLGVRLDRWEQRNGVRREIDLAAGSALIDRSFESRSGWVANGRAGFRALLTDNVIARAAVYSGFRIPTLNELYRPFRVGNDITEANEALQNERLAGAEIGLMWTDDRMSATVTVFRNDLFDPIINATVTTTPGFNTDLGVFIPDGGSLRQRRNIDRVETWGLELDATLELSAFVELRAAYLLTNPKIKKSNVLPSLAGNRLAQVARHQGTLSLSLHPTPRLDVALDVLASSDQFEDDLNSRVLNGAVTADAQVAYLLTDNIKVFFAAENIFDTKIEAGKNAAGLVTLGAPVFLWLGMRLTY